MFFFSGSGDHRHLHSFPTRRSSDLDTRSIATLGSVWVLSAILAGIIAGEKNRRFWLWFGFGLLTGPYALYRADRDRKSTRLNSSHSSISYAVFCLKKKKKHTSSLHS